MKIFKSISAIMLVALAAFTVSGCQKNDATAGSAPIGTYTAKGHTNSFYVADNNDIVGQNKVVKARVGDTMHRLAASYDVGVQEIIDANPNLDKTQIKFGQKVVIPKQYILPPRKYRNGIVINVAEMRLYYFTPDGKHVTTYPVALGRQGWRTPLGKTYVSHKKVNPTWRPPESIRKFYASQGEYLPKVVPPGKDNPLGKYALYLGIPGYLIHGTNSPASVGQTVSSGCIRMYNRDIKELFAQVGPRTPVHIINYPTKVGFRKNKMYIESHTRMTDTKGHYQKNTVSARDAIREATNGRNVKVNQDAVRTATSNRLGQPVQVGKSS